jgi:hypothetical protein
MSEFNKFHTIHIQIPAEMLYETPSGILKLVPSLTKTGNLSKRNKHASIVIEKTNNLKPTIKYEGSKGQLVKKGKKKEAPKEEAKEEAKEEIKTNTPNKQSVKKQYNVIKAQESDSESETDEEPEPPKAKPKEKQEAPRAKSAQELKYTDYQNKEQKYMGIINKLREKEAITTAKKNDLLGFLEDEDYKKLDKALEKYGIKQGGARLPDDVQKFVDSIFKKR